jgi:hypothetical protein
MYPDAYDEKEDVIDIELCSVRAANSIRIKYDMARDGWQILMDKTRDVDCGCEVIQENVEVAFIPAWLED